MSFSIRRLMSVRSALYISTAVGLGLAANATAQTVAVQPSPVRENVDANEVDLFTGRINVKTPSLSVGNDDELLSVSFKWNGRNWIGSYAGSIIIENGAYIVSIGTKSDRFTHNGSSFVSTEANGATLTFDGSTYRYADSGTTVYLSKSQPNITNYEAVSTRIDTSDGKSVRTNWEYASVEGQHIYRFDAYTDEADNRVYIFYRAQSYYDSGIALYNFNDISYVIAGHGSGGSNNYAFLERGDNGLSWTTYDGKRTEYRTPGGKLTSIQRPGSGSPDVTVEYSGDRVSGVTTPAGRTGYSSYDSGTRRIVTVTNPASHSTVYEFDVGSQRLRTLRDPAGRVTNWDYDFAGRVISMVAPEGNKVLTAYDVRGNVVERRQVSKTPGSPPDIVETTTYPTNCANLTICDQPSSTTDARGFTTEYSYDPAHGGLTAVTSPAASNGVRPQVRFTYQGLYSSVTGQPVYKVSSISNCRTAAAGGCTGTADETRTQYTYDPSTMLKVSETVGAGDASVSATRSYSYDVIGNLTSVDGPLPGAVDVARLFYNQARQVTMAVSPDPDGGGAARSRAVSLAYDAKGRVVSQEAGTSDGDGNGFVVAQTVTTDHDLADRKVRETAASGGTTYGVTQYSYDANGRLVCSALRMDPSQWSSQTDACIAQTNGGNGADRVTRSEYYNDGRLKQQIAAFGTPDASEESLTYTLNGQVLSATDANGNVTTNAYDGHDRLATTTYPGGSYEQLTYDPNGNVLTRRLRDGQALHYGYDALNRRVHDDNPNTNVAEVDVTYAYNSHGQLLSASDQNGWFNAFEYDALGRATRQYGNLSSNTLQYDISGRLTRQTWADGFYVTYDHLITGEVTTIRENGSLALATYGYDDLGRRSSLIRGNGTVTTYGYDPASRLSSLGQDLAGTGHDLTVTFGYNPAGQITTRTSSNDAYAFGQLVNIDRPYAVNGLNQYTQSGSVTPTYDTRGNLTSAGGDTYGYNTRNHLSFKNSQLFYQGPLGMLVQTPSANFDYVGANLSSEIGSGIERRYVYGPGADEPLVWYEGSGTGDRRWLHADERGSIIAITDGGGNKLAINTYDEYGIPGSGNIGRFQYTGQKWIGELGMYDYKARTYSPTLGRFLQTDPIGYGDGLNWYSYVGGDPINMTDSTGLEADIVVTARRSVLRADGDIVVTGSRSNGSWSGTANYNPAVGKVPTFNTSGASSLVNADDETVVTGQPQNDEIVVTANFGPKGKKGGVNRGRGNDPLYGARTTEQFADLVRDLLADAPDKSARNAIRQKAKRIAKEKGFRPSGQWSGLGLGSALGPLMLIDLSTCLAARTSVQCPEWIPRSVWKEY